MCIVTPWKPLKVCKVEPYVLEDFSIVDSTRKLEDIDSITQCPKDYERKQTEACIVFYRVIFNEKNSFPSECEAIKINANLTLQLHCEGSTVLAVRTNKKSKNVK